MALTDHRHTGTHSCGDRQMTEYEKFVARAVEINKYAATALSDSDSRHRAEECNCGRPGCMFCDGGLFVCTVCLGMEGSLPTFCPGTKMTLEQRNSVYDGELDFQDGHWVAGVSLWSPALWLRVRQTIAEEDE